MYRLDLYISLYIKFYGVEYFVQVDRCSLDFCVWSFVDL